MSFERFIDPHLFGLILSSFILLYLIILIGLLVQVLFINFWNDKWCGTIFLTNIVGLSNDASIPDTVSQFWTDGDWNISLSLQQMSHLFSHIMVRTEHDIPNGILDESSHFTLNSTKTFFLGSSSSLWLGKIYLVFISSAFQNSCQLESFSWATSYRSAYSK